MPVSLTGTRLIPQSEPLTLSSPLTPFITEEGSACLGGHRQGVCRAGQSLRTGRAEPYCSQLLEKEAQFFTKLQFRQLRVDHRWGLHHNCG